MAVMEARLNGDEAFNLSRLDQIWQHKYWGEDEEDAERINDLRVEINELCGILKFI
jgi:chaperone required for assembly of F1-ATPase